MDFTKEKLYLANLRGKTRALPIKFEIGMRSRSDPQNIVVFQITAIHYTIRQKPDPICIN
jgi:hypothetical protein